VNFMPNLRPLLAVDWVEIIIFLFIVGSSLFGQLFKAAQQQRKKSQRVARPPAQARPVATSAQARPAPRAPQARPAATPPQARPPGGQRPAAAAGPVQPRAGQPPVADAGRPKTALEKEIEAFLGRSTGQTPPAPAARQERSPARTEQKPPATRRRPSTPTPDRPRPVEPDRSFSAQESVAEHVQRHIQRGGVAQRDAHLGETLEQSDERLETHLQDVFQHRLGNLQREAAPSPSAIAQGTDAGVWVGGRPAHPLADELYEMLSTPQKVRTAILLSEILRRPDERWEI
jgi:hypothetical protein